MHDPPSQAAVTSVTKQFEQVEIFPLFHYPKKYFNIRVSLESSMCGVNHDGGLI